MVSVIFYIITALMFIGTAYLVCCAFVFPNCKFIKKVVGSFETDDEYILIGLWGFTDSHIDTKIKYLEINGVHYDGICPLRKVDKFPDYLSSSRIY